MAGQIGLKAVMDTRDFQRGMTRYLGSMRQMQGVTGKVAGTAGLAMMGFATGISTALSMTAVNALNGFIDKIGEAIGALKEFGKEALLSAARVAEMATVLDMMGESAGYSAAELDNQVDRLKALGIRTDVAQKLVSQLIRYNIDLAKSEELASAARDFAVHSYEDTSEALQGLIHGIVTLNARVLRTHGSIVRVGKAQEEYADTLNKSSEDLSDQERILSVLNAVIEDSVRVTGSYETAMETGGKQLRSFDRYIYELSLNLSGPFLGAFTDVVFMLASFIKSLTAATAEGGFLRPILEDIAVKVEEITTRVSSLVRALTTVITKLNLALGGPAQLTIGGTKDAIQRLRKELADLEVPDLAEGWADQADEIEEVNQDLTEAIGELWAETYRRIQERRADLDLKQARALEDHLEDLTDVWDRLERSLTDIVASGEEDREAIRERVADDQAAALEDHEDKMERLRKDAALAETKEEHDLIQEMVKAEEGRFAEEQALIAAEGEEELRAARKKMEAELTLEREKAQALEADRIKAYDKRVAREEEDFRLRTQRQEEQSRREEARAKEAAAERVAILEDAIKRIQEGAQGAYDAQAESLRESIAEQRDLLERQKEDWKFAMEARPAEAEAARAELSKVFDSMGLDYERFYQAYLEEDWGVVGAIIGVGILTGMGNARNALRDSWTQIQAEIGIQILLAGLKFKADAAASGRLLVAGIVDGIETRAADLSRDFTGLADDIVSAVEGIQSRLWNVMVTVGRDLIRGIVSGLYSLGDWLGNVMGGIIDHAIALAKWRLGIGSPSKVFFNVGQEMIRGWVMGLQSLADLPGLEVGQIAGGTMQSISNVTTNNYEFNQTVHSAAPVSTVASDFHQMAAVIGG